MKTVRVVLSDEAQEAYEYLNERAPTSKIEHSIFRAIENKRNLIRANPQYGEPIPKKQIPAEYVQKYGNMKYELQRPN